MSRVVTNAGPWLTCVVLLLAGCATEPPQTSVIDFHQEVAPIFKARCLNCHGQHQQQGGLRLDEKTFALSGGLSGKKLIGTSAENSELLRRVTSDDPTVVMPKEGGRLSEREIDTLRRWVQAKAPWPEKTPPSGRDEFLTRYGNDLFKRLGVVGGEPKVYFLLLFAILVGIAERVRRLPVDQPHAREDDTSACLTPTSSAWAFSWLTARPAHADGVAVKQPIGIRGWDSERWLHRLCQHVSLAGFVAVVLCTVLWDVVAFTMRQSSELAINEQKLVAATAAGETRPVMLNGAQPTPLRPRGTRGLGGTYYRGNDERNEKLFNGGDYRTAILRLSLIDEHDQPVAIGQPQSGSQLFVRLEIERAANASPTLFTDQIMGDMLLTQRVGDRKEPMPTDEPAKLEVLQIGDRWAAKYRLGDFDGQPEVALNGIVYVYTNPVRTQESIQGTLQYGIVYTLRIRERTLQENSELWLGPILVPGNFQYPTPGRITLNEWLDTQPIPEITGDNSRDPALLGIPEHLEKTAKPSAR
ncbi:MAG: c-type cytochrome domain-containing protein [Planctomycetaceae bacterium]